MGKKKRAMAKEQLNNDKFKGDKAYYKRGIAEKDNKVIYYIIFTFYLVSLIYPPFFRGMYFDDEFLVAHILTSILSITWFVHKMMSGEKRLLKDPIDYGGATLLAAYVLSSFFAVNPRAAWGEVLKYINYFFILLMASKLPKNIREIKASIYALGFSVFGVAFVGIGAAAGTINYNGAWVGGRINSTLQYPNTTAALLMAGYVLILSLMDTAENKWLKALLNGVNFTVLLAFVFTYSRGAWIIIPFILAIYIVFIPKGTRSETVVDIISALIPLGIVMKGFNNAITSNAGGAAWKWYFIGLIISILIGIVLNGAINFVKKNIRAVSYASAFVAILVVVAVIYIMTAQTELVMSHDSNQPDSDISVIRFVDVKPDTDYILSFDIRTKESTNKPWDYGVIIQSRDYLDTPTNITEKYGKATASRDNVIVNFKTLKNSKRVAIIFMNKFAGTTAIIDNAFVQQRGSSEKSYLKLKYKYIPESIASRIADISFTTKNSTERMIFYKDAFKIYKDYILLGAGGGAWASLYFMYQSYLYWTTQTHDYFMQVMVETGTLGLLALFFLIGGFLYGAVRGLKIEDKKNKALFVGVVSSAIALWWHSALDFDLSLGAVALFLWTLMGLMYAFLRLNGIDTTLNIKTDIGYKGAIVLAIAALIFSTSLKMGQVYSKGALTQLKASNYAGAVQLYRKAVAFDPLNAGYRLNYGKALEALGQQSGNNIYVAMSQQMFEKAVGLEPYNSQYNAELAAFYLRHGAIDKGLKYIDKSVAVQPLRPQNYQQKADAYFKVGQYYMTNGDKAAAQKYFNVVLKIPDDIKRVNRKILKPIEMTPDTQRIIDEAKKSLEIVKA
ncbi:O-Antigen ligase [Caldanaerobius fijiensis DSM 17918]|uniref:O-Antigen ligase n=1 Tax=Caldanaerobius fijiensis DSM 17918 TaxID=1121256 RepID=A0A1M4USW5_9THEO|nr:O-antigen ligase family protein [Caldanaerobius fijiensis]SHE59768.1 O-Antigen ligase [Caldanaerobius fijiensis DSM 17918]